MTDEQWLWVFANWSLDDDEKLETMCDKCKDEASSHNKCSVCGAKLHNSAESFTNPNFDRERFERFKKLSADSSK